MCDNRCMMMESLQGVFFDITRGSVHDGPGVRTTVFLKGCPLRCLWCHNPESWRFEPQLFCNGEKCVNCLACVAVCPTGAQQAQDGRHIIRFELCKTCGKCMEACPRSALRIIGYREDPTTIFSEIMRDKDFYDMSGGGATFSGGEPLLQTDVTLDLLKKCRSAAIHTCLETCGYVSQEDLGKAASSVDLFLFDYKSTGAAVHKNLTGVTNDLILANLDYLYKRGAAIILRCPMIPGINDTMEHFRGIAELAARYPRLQGVEILPYHNLGLSKGAGLGINMALPDLQTVTADKKAEWAETLKTLGCENIKIQ